MRKLLTISAVAVLVTLIATPARAQVVATDAYQLAYFDNQLRGFRFINTGQIGSPIDPATKHGTVCADIYLFDANQEMLACCNCPTTANALGQLTGVSSLTQAPFSRGVIKIVADAGCDETSITTPVNGGLRAFMTNLEIAESVPGGVATTETLFQPAPLTVQEQQFLGQACSFVHYLGSGRGTCVCGAQGSG